MDLKTYDREQMRNLEAAASRREQFKLLGAGLETWYEVKGYGVGADYRGQFVQVTLQQATEAVGPPAPTIWNGPGDGLPPVGMTVEVKNERHGRTDKKWIVCEIAYISEQYAILKSDELIGQKEAVVVPSECLFRPIRTAEQLAAEEREKEVGKMLATVNYAPWEAAHYKLFAERLYDAGARMPGEGSKA